MLAMNVYGCTFYFPVITTNKSLHFCDNTANAIQGRSFFPGNSPYMDTILDSPVSVLK